MNDKRDMLRQEVAALIARGGEILRGEQEVINAIRERDMASYRITDDDDDDEDAGDETSGTIKDIYPTFVEDYQRWYSSALRVIKQLLPERLPEFVAFYEGGGTWTIRRYIRDRETPDTLFRSERNEGFQGALRHQVFFLRASEDRLDDVLADIRGVLEAELFDTSLQRAEELAKKKHLRAAGVLAGVVLEAHLKDVCRNHGIKLRKQKPTIGDLNDALKDGGVYDTPPWRRVQHLADIRNLAGHDREREPTSEEVEDLLRGVGWATKSLF
jgi:hypothetical protein